MSNALAIAAVTSTLQGILQRSLVLEMPPTPEVNIGNPAVTTSPLDRARRGRENLHQLNLYLFQVVPNGQLRNVDLGGQRSPVALDLHYLVSAFAGGDDDRPAHMLLGQAMRILNDHAVLGAAEIQQFFRGSDLGDQIEKVRVTPRQISLEDLARVWSMGQIQARLSVAYVASVVLIDSAAPRRDPLPVLRRGPLDRGVVVDPVPDFPGPHLDELVVPQNRPFALPGDVLLLPGQQLRAAEVRVRLTHPRLTAPIDLTPANTSTPSRLTVTLPTKADVLPAGVYGLTVVLRDGGVERITGSFALPVAPEITSPLTAKRNKDGVVTFVVDTRTVVLPTQVVSLILNDREIPAPTRKDPTQKLTFTFTSPLGQFLARLRVDGVDSDILDRAADPPAFNNNRKLTITNA